jgi:hypothetical protein
MAARGIVRIAGVMVEEATAGVMVVAGETTTGTRDAVMGAGGEEDLHAILCLCLTDPRSSCTWADLTSRRLRRLSVNISLKAAASL